MRYNMPELFEVVGVRTNRNEAIQFKAFFHD